MRLLLLTFFLFNLSLPSMEKVLSQNCVSCHGGVIDGKRKVKGDFDIVPLIRKGINEQHTQHWVKVVEQIQNGDMPPEDSDYKLSDKEKLSIIEAIYKKLDKKEIPERTLTPFEISNSVSKVLNFDKEIYDPFENLYFHKNLDSTYQTIDSVGLVNAVFTNDLEYSLSKSIGTFLGNDGFKGQKLITFPLKDQMIGKKFRLEARRRGVHMYDRGPIYYVNFLNPPPLSISNETKKKVSDPKKKAEIKKVHAAEINKFVQSVISSGKQHVLDFRMSGKARFYSPKDKASINLPAGRYRLTFTADSLNRSVVKQQFSNTKKPPKGLDNWSSLLHNKARLAIYHGGINSGSRSGNVPHSKPGKLLHLFEIEDNKKQEYSCEFELTVPGAIFMEFANGPYSSRLNRLGLGKASKGKKQLNKQREDYVFPAIRIYSEIIAEKIPSKQSFLSKYRLGKTAPESQLKEKLKHLLNELSLTQYNDFFQSIYDEMPGDSYQRYMQTVKWIFMSQEQLYLNYSPADLTASSRFVSYSLLKTHPSTEFIKDYKAFRSGDMDHLAFTQKISKNPMFNSFISQFINSWLGHETVLDIVKFSEKERALPFKKEATAYLMHIFQNNRPVKEVFSSGYKIANASLADFYGMRDKSYKFDMQLIKAPGGLLNQANFFIARSDGIDGLPFDRAKWVGENIFGYKFAEPPGDINVDLFKAEEKNLSFKERTIAHAQNKACIGCHKKLDPIAFAMNNFDTLGRMLPDADKSAEKELQERVTQMEEKMARSFTRNLISCIIGRDSNVHDLKTVESILKKTEKEGYRSRDILAKIILHYFKK